MMNVHIIAHTHDDPGWKITVDQYYYKREYIQWRLVNSKIDGAKGEIKILKKVYSISMDIKFKRLKSEEKHD